MAAKREVEYRFLLVGKSGSGKSSTANNIMGENLFVTSTGLAAGTVTCEVRKSSRPQKGITFRIADTPGLFDPEKSNKEIANEILKASANLHPGLHAVLYVLKPDRYTPEERETFNQLKKIFDPNVVKHVIIIFTKGDELKKQKMSKETLLQQANDHFKQVLQECSNRVIVFNNAKRDSKQTKELLEIVDKIWIENGEKTYSCPIQSLVNEKLERRVAIRTQQRIEKDPALSKVFSVLGEEFRKAVKEAKDQQRLVEDTRSRKEMTETLIAEKTAAQEKEKQERKQREQEEKEKQEKAEKEKKDLEEKKKLEEEEKERKRKEEEKKAEEEQERRRQQQELEQLKKELEKVKLEEKMNRKLAEEKQKVEEEYRRKLEDEKEKYTKEEMEKTKHDIVKDKETHWSEDVWQGAANLAGGAWKYAKGWLGW